MVSSQSQTPGQARYARRRWFRAHNTGMLFLHRIINIPQNSHRRNTLRPGARYIESPCEQNRQIRQQGKVGEAIRDKNCILTFLALRKGCSEGCEEGGVAGRDGGGRGRVVYKACTALGRPRPPEHRHRYLPRTMIPQLGLSWVRKWT